MLENDLEAETQPGENASGLELIWTQQLCQFNTWMLQNSGNMSYLRLLVCFCLYTNALYFIVIDSKRMVANGEREVGFVEGRGGVI